MTYRSIMARNLSFCVLDRRTSIWVSPRKFSTMTLPVFYSHFTITNTFPSIHGSHSRHLKHAITKHIICKPPHGRNMKGIRYMSSSKDPPDDREDPLSFEKIENRLKEKRITNNGLENMFKMVQETSTGFQSLGKQISEKSSSVVSKVTPEIELTLSKHKEGDGKKKTEDWNDILNRWYVKYQDFIGITDLKRAQDRVTELSEELLVTQSRRRNLQAELEELQEQISQNHQRITKAELYSDEHYMLFDQARDLNARVKEARSEFVSCERRERDTFTELSAAIRECHERERTQAEQSKYWSIIASIVSAALASVITSINNWVRIREIKDHVSNNNQSLLDGYQKMHEDVVQAVNGGIANISLPVITKDPEPAPSIPVVEQNSQVLPDNSVSSTVKLSEEDVTLLSKTLEETFKEQLTTSLAKETTLVKETIIPYFDAVFANLKLILESNQALANTLSVGKMEDPEVLAEEKIEIISPSLPEDIAEKQDLNKSVVEYSYKHIASAMAVGASIGTLATAFFLGSFSGGTVD